MPTLMDLFNLLLNAYGKRNWWPAETPFEMMVGAILTQNTTWSNVEKAIDNLKENLNPDFIESVSNQELAELIRPSGYYNQKAIKLKELVKWFQKYNCDIEQIKRVDGDSLRAEMLKVKGIGRETADSILTYALDKSFFVVDAYTRRILSRIGYNIPEDYDDIRNFIEAEIPRDLYIYNEFHALIVYHAKQYCRKKPECEHCPINSNCQKRI
jgi:endonuclease-3 related protein